MTKTRAAIQRLFWRHAGEEPLSIRHKLLDPQKGLYLYFRRIKTPIQARFAELMDHHTLPQVFLHGSPHVDNYAKTLSGAGIIDFDRAHYGPYAWDLVCLLLSVTLRETTAQLHFSRKMVGQALHEGYQQGFHFPEQGYREYTPLAHAHPKLWEQTTQSYLQANKKWAKKLRHGAISIDDPVALEILRQYFASRKESIQLNHYRVTEIAYCSGTFGRSRFLIALQPQDRSQDALLLDMKQTKDYMIRAWPHHRWYHNPFDHQGQRMIAAAQLYAPACAIGEGYATVNGVEYWGRQIPTLNRKPAKLISVAEQVDFAYAAGSQVGRGHRLSLQHITERSFMHHVENHFDEIVSVTRQIHHELLATWQAYCRLGLGPTNS